MFKTILSVAIVVLALAGGTVVAVHTFYGHDCPFASQPTCSAPAVAASCCDSVPACCDSATPACPQVSAGECCATKAAAAQPALEVLPAPHVDE